MAVAAIDICNGALALLGENAVAVNDNSKAWNTFNTLYLNSILTPVLSSYPWNALKTRAALTAPSVPITGGSYNSGTSTVTLTLGTTAAVSAAAWANNAITFTIGSHTLQVGMQVTVAGSNPTGYNGNYVIVAVTGTTIVVMQTTNPGAYVSGAALTWLMPSLAVGQTITVSGLVPTDWNGIFVVTASSPNTVSYTLVSVNAFVSGGSMTWSPLFDYSYIYYLPADCIRVIMVNRYRVGDYYGFSSFGYYALMGDDGGYMPPFKIENGFLLTNESTIDVLYVQLQNPPQDGILVDLCIIKARAKMTYAITGDSDLEEKNEKKYEAAYARAKNINTNQGTPDVVQDDSWIRARR